MPTFEPAEPQNIETLSITGDDNAGEITIQLKPEWKQNGVLGRLVFDAPKGENADYVVIVTEYRSRVTELYRNRFGFVLGSPDGRRLTAQRVVDIEDDNGKPLKNTLDENLYYRIQYLVTPLVSAATAEN